jgi:hypothetical protein
MPRICRPINPMEGRDYLTLDGRVRPHPVIRDRLLRGRAMLSVLWSWRTAQVEFAGICFRGEASTEAAYGPSDSRFQQPKWAQTRSLRTAAALMRGASRSLCRHWDAPRADSRVLPRRPQ